MTAGRAGEAVRTGIHVRGNGDPVTRVGFTVQQALGQPVPAWGEGEMQVSARISEILADESRCAALQGKKCIISEMIVVVVVAPAKGLGKHLHLIHRLGYEPWHVMRSKSLG